MKIQKSGHGNFDCKYNCKYQVINDFEVHFKKIENATSKTKIKICRK